MDITRPFRGESARALTARARLDRSLQAGEIPDELLGGERGLLRGRLEQYFGSQWDEPAIPDLAGTQHHRFRSRCVQASIGAGGMGAMFAGSLAFSLAAGGPFGWALAAALGGAAGTAYALWQMSSHFRGQVEVSIDGQGAKHPFYEDTDSFSRSPAEWRAYLASRGELGDQLGTTLPYMDGRFSRYTSATANPGPSLAERMESARLSADPALPAALREAAAARRVVADHGSQSLYGHAVLDVVDAHQAALDAAAQVPLYLVSGLQVRDVAHRYEEKARTPDGKVSRQVDNASLERQFDYRLSPLDLNDIPPGEGVPAPLAGVYRFADSVAETVAVQGDQASNSTSMNGEQHSQAERHDRLRRY